MEDKRTLLAFLLIGLILLLMQPYYEWMGLAPSEEERAFDEIPAPTERRQAPATISEPEFVAPAVAAPRRGDDPRSGVAATPGAAFVPRLIRVSTPLTEMDFSTKGGVLVSVRPSGFEREVGEPVELVPEGGSGLNLSLRLEGDGPETARDLSDIEFTTNRESVRLGEHEEGTLRLRADLGDGRYIEKRLTFYGDRYGVDVTVEYAGFDDRTVAWLGWRSGIAIAERDASADVQGMMRVAAYMNDSLSEYFADEDEPQRLTEKGQLRWAAVRNKYFLACLAPLDDARRWLEMETGAQPQSATVRPHLSFNVGTRMAAAGTMSFLLYAGPLYYEEVIRYDVEMERAMDLGFPVVREISKLLIVLFVAAYAYVPNYGFVIILFAVAIKILLYPLTQKSFKSAAMMQELQPKIAALREKYKNDNQRLSRETMALYKEEGVNPLGGCLPMVLQMPIFFAMYSTFSSTIELRQAPFIWWMQDLSSADEIVVAGFGLHVLPLLMAGAMFVQSKMTMKDPKQAALVYMMPLVMVFFMWDFSSGLVLYWTCFNVLQIAQQSLTNHMKKKSAAGTAPSAAR